MELMQAILERRTIRAFRSDPVSPELLDEVLEAGTWAPSHFNAQPWEFILIGNQARYRLLDVFRERLEAGPLKNPNLPEERKEAMRCFAKDFGGAPVLVAVICPPAINETDQIDYPLAAAAAVQNLLLSAWGKQLGGVWLSLGQVSKAQDVLNLQTGYKVIGIVALGYFDSAPPPQPRTPVAEKLHRIP